MNEEQKDCERCEGSGIIMGYGYRQSENNPNAIVQYERPMQCPACNKEPEGQTVEWIEYDV